MSKWLYAKLMNVQTKRAILKMDHLCDDCGKVGPVIRGLSILYLILYVIAGILIAFFFKWWLGLIAVYLLCTINVKLSKPQCTKCVSKKVRLLTEEDKAKMAGHHHE